MITSFRVEDATSTRKRTSNNISYKSRGPSVVVNKYPENQHSYGRKLSASGSKFSKRKKQMGNLSDSIPRGITRHSYLVNSPTSFIKIMLSWNHFLVTHVWNQHLKNKKFDTAVLHLRVNDLLNDESQDFAQNLRDNLKQIGLKCKSAGVKRILFSGIVVNNKLTKTYISSVNQRSSNMCRDNSFAFNDNNNMPTSSFFRDGLHLLEIGKCILVNNFIDKLNIF